MLPEGKPMKSATSQPLVELLGPVPGGICTSTGTSAAVTLSAPGPKSPVNVMKSAARPST